MYLDIKKFYTRENAKILFFGHVNALRFNIPNATLEHCAANFMKYYKLNAETFNVKSAIQEYQRMCKEYFETEKTDTTLEQK